MKNVSMTVVYGSETSQRRKKSCSGGIKIFAKTEGNKHQTKDAIPMKIKQQFSRKKYLYKKYLNDSLGTTIH